jgi:homoserine kinase type II
MAVYTDLSDDDLQGLVALYAIGDLLSAKGIVEGVTNTNYLLVTTTGPYILTLYESRTNESDLPFFLGLMDHWGRRGIVCPQALAGRDGKTLRPVAGKPAGLFSFLNGMPVRHPTRKHVAALGAAVATAHLASESFGLTRANALGIGAWQEFFSGSAGRADEIQPGFAQGIAAEIAFLQAAWPQGLPRGAIHADLSPDNVFFQGESLSGIIDFSYACTDYYAYELALLLNDWCFEADGQFNITKARELFASYTAKRKLTREEIAAMPVLARGASIPYLLTRLYDWFNRAGSLGQRKSPLDYWVKLKFHAQVKSAAEYGLFE